MKMKMKIIFIISLLFISALPFGLIEANTEDQQGNNSTIDRSIKKIDLLEYYKNEAMRSKSDNHEQNAPNVERGSLPIKSNEKINQNSAKQPYRSIGLSTYEEIDNRQLNLSSGQFNFIKNGNLVGNNSNPWDGKTVELYVDNVLVDTDITTSSGAYSLVYAFTYADIGRHYYTVEFQGEASPFPGLLPAYPARQLSIGHINVTDTITVETVVSDQNLAGQTGGELSINQNYIYSTNLKFSDGSAFNPLTFTYLNDQNNTVSANQLRYSFNETYSVAGNTSVPGIDLAKRLSVSNQLFTGSSISQLSNTGNQTVDNVRIDLLFNLTTVFNNFSSFAPFLTFNPKLQNITNIHTVVLDYVYTVNFSIGSKLITAQNQSLETYYRNETITINGLLSNAAAPNTVVNHPVSVELLYKPINNNNPLTVFSSFTDANGSFQFIFTLNDTTFTTVNDSLTINVYLYPGTPGTVLSLNQANRTKTRVVDFRTNVTSLVIDNIKAINDSKYGVYIYQNDTFSLTGKVYYDINTVAIGVDVNATIIGSTTNYNIGVNRTGLLGNFTFIITPKILSNLISTDKNFTIVITIVAPAANNNDSRFYDPLSITGSTLSFNVSKTVSINATNIFGDVLVNGNSTNVFNVTMSDLLNQTNASYNITVQDNTGRAPDGMYLNVTEVLIRNGNSSMNFITFTQMLLVNSSQTFYSINIHNLTQAFLNATEMNEAGTKFMYIIQLVHNNGTVLITLSETFTIFGEDEDKPELDLGSVVINGETGTASNITVFVTIAANTLPDNVRAVYLYWRFSDNSFITNQGGATFSGGYNKSIMIAMNATTYNFTIFFRDINDNGRWIEYYFIIYDFAGRGLHADNSTAAFNEYPTYNQNFNLSTSYLANIAYIKMGDAESPMISGSTIDSATVLNNNVFVCINGANCKVYSGSWTPVYNSSVKIELRNLNDLTAIDYVNITYSQRQLDPLTLQPITGWQNVTVTMILNGTSYYYLFNSSFFQYYYELNFKFYVVDTVGNSDSTNFMNTYGLLQPKLDRFTIKDTGNPFNGTMSITNQTSIDFTTVQRPYSQSNINLYELVSSETANISVTISDSGIGLLNISINYYIYSDYDQTTLLTSGTFNVNLNGELTYNFTFIIPSQIYSFSGVIFFDIIYYDRAGNSETINNDPLKDKNIQFIVIDRISPNIADFQVSTENTTDFLAGSAGRLNSTATVYEAWLNESLILTFNITDLQGVGLKNLTFYYSFTDFNGQIVSFSNFTAITGEFYVFSFLINESLYSINDTLQFYLQVFDIHGNTFEYNNDPIQSNNVEFVIIDRVIVDTKKEEESVELTADSQSGTVDLRISSAERKNTNVSKNVYEVYYYENIAISINIADVYGVGLDNLTLTYFIYDANGVLVGTPFIVFRNINGSVEYQFSYSIPVAQLVINGQVDFIIKYFGVQGNSVTLNNNPNSDDNIKFQISDNVAPDFNSVSYTNATSFNLLVPESDRPFTNTSLNIYQVGIDESIVITVDATDTILQNGIGLGQITLVLTYRFANGSLFLNTTTQRIFGAETTVIFQVSPLQFNHNMTISLYFFITDLEGNRKFVNKEANGNDNIKFLIIDPKQIEVPVTTTTSSPGATTQGNNNSALIVFGFMAGVVFLVLYYRRRTFIDYLQRQRRGRIVRGTMATRIDQIKQLGLNGDYKRAVLSIWKAVQTLGSEALQSPQKYNQTVRDYLKILERVSTVDREVLETLGFTFEKAKYGRDPITVDEFNETLQALNVAIETVIATGIQSSVEDEDDWAELDI